MSDRDGKLVSGEGYQNQVGGSPKLPTVQIAAEDYRRIARMAKMGDNPVLELDVDTRYLDDDTHAYNIIADLPGTDPRPATSWRAPTSTVGSPATAPPTTVRAAVVVMEAARILASDRRAGRSARSASRFGRARSRACSARSTM